MFALVAGTVHRTVAFDWFESYLNRNKKEKPHQMVWFSFLVDDIGLEPMTFRTSSGCWISRPIQKVQKSTGNTFILRTYYIIKLKVNQAKSAKKAAKLTFC